MKELLEILSVARRLRAEGRGFAVATVVKIGGSTYRRPGARMLIDASAQTWGTISGGCLEGEVAQQALRVMQEGRPRLIPFELGEDDLVLGFGTGCDGIVHVFIEPVASETESDVLTLLERIVESRATSVLATVTRATGKFESSVGFHALVDGDGGANAGEPGRTDDQIDDDLLPELLRGARELYRDACTEGREHLWHSWQFENESGSADVLLEIVHPPIRLVVFGEGHDVRSLVAAGRLMGWPVVVVGRKPIEILADRFPDATEQVFLMHPDDAVSHTRPDARTAAVVMNHAYVRDRDLLAELVQSEVAYIGMLGPRERTHRMLRELADEGVPITDEHRARIYGPVGLDIGTETPEEIALATAAEIQQELNRRSGENLRQKAEPIHAARLEK